MENLELLGGELCLDFVNTVDWRGSQTPEEFLQTFQDLITWSQHVNILPDQDAQKLLRKAAEHPVEAESVHKQAIALRETLYRIFASVIQGKDPKKEDLTRFNARFSSTMSQSCILKTAAGFSWDSSGNKETLDWILNPIIRSAADLLVSEQLKRLKTCTDPRCGWLFLDKSRNSSRRWCNMKACGNRAKATRFYRRKQPARSS